MGDNCKKYYPVSLLKPSQVSHLVLPHSIGSYSECCFSDKKTLLISITESCNQGCSHCMRSSELGKSKSVDISGIVESVRKALKHADIKNVVISGGEPTLVENLPDVVSAISHLGVNVGICSNGLRVDQKLSKELSVSGLHRFTIGFEGVRATHNLFRQSPHGFEKGLNGLLEILKVNIPVTVNLTLWNGLLNQVDEVIDVFSNLAIENICVTVPMMTGRAINHISKFNELTNSKIELFVSHLVENLDYPVHVRVPRCNIQTCPSGKSIFAISKNGDVVGCPDVGAVSALDFDDVYRNV